MVRRALWRARPGDPRTAFGWFFRDDSVRWLPVPIAFLLMAAVGALAVGWSAWALLFLPLILLHVRHRPRPPSDLSALATIPAPGPSFRCRMELFHDSNAVYPTTLLGTDEGILTFVEGWLHFAGERSEFSFRRVEVANDAFLFGSKRLVLREAGTVAFTDLETTKPWWRYHLPSELELAFKAWAGSDSVPVGEPILPPSQIHPSGIARAWRAFATSFVLLFVLLFLTEGVYRNGGFAVFVFIQPLIAPFKQMKTVRALAKERRNALAEERTAAIGL